MLLTFACVTTTASNFCLLCRSGARLIAIDTYISVANADHHQSGLSLLLMVAPVDLFFL